MNREEFIEFHKYLAMLIYDYTLMLQSDHLTLPAINEIRKILSSLEKVQEICLIERNNENEK